MKKPAGVIFNSSMNIRKKILLCGTLLAYVIFQSGCFIPQSAELEKVKEQKSKIVGYITIDDTLVDCQTGPRGFAEISNDSIVRSVSLDSVQTIPLSQVKKIYTSQFTLTGTIVAAVLIVAIPAGLYALAIRHALSDPQR